MNPRTPPLSTITEPGSIDGAFNHHRTYPQLPEGYDWETQKNQYCPPGILQDLHDGGLEGKDTGKHRFGYVFCHRGLYERALGIIDNSGAAIDNGTRQGFFLHEVDAFIWKRVEEAFLSHDKIARRVTGKKGDWRSYPIQEVLDTLLVRRRVNTEANKVDFASSYLETDQKVPGLLATIWNKTLKPGGCTLQIDLRDDDFAKAIAYYLVHISETNIPRKTFFGRDGTLVWSIFRSTILKGTTMGFSYYKDLVFRIQLHCEELYGEFHFKSSQLTQCPPLIIVFYPKTLKILAEKAAPTDSRTPRPSFQHIYDTFMAQVMSFVEVGNGDQFILEIVHSGLGLGYNKEDGTAKNPLDWALLKNEEIIYESCIDRAMIDVSLELRRQYPQLLFSSCTRLPDIITTRGSYKGSYDTASLVKIEDGESGLSAKLRAMPGGLYPQSNIVVADDPAAEIAARTWIDQNSDLDRSELLKYSYNTWLNRADKSVVDAIKQLNTTDFPPNRFGYSSSVDVDAAEDRSTADFDTKVRAWLEITRSHVLNPDIANLTSSDNGSQEDNSNNGRKEATSAENFNFSPGQCWGDYEECDLDIAGAKFTFKSEDAAKHEVAISAASPAAGQVNVDAVAKYLSNGIKNNYCIGGSVNTLLSLSCASDHDRIVKFLIDSRADIHRNEAHGSPLLVASGYGHSKPVENLSAALGNTKLNGKMTIGTAIHVAAHSGHDAIVKPLLERGTQVDHSDILGFKSQFLSLFKETEVDLSLNQTTSRLKQDHLVAWPTQHCPPQPAKGPVRRGSHRDSLKRRWKQSPIPYGTNCTCIICRINEIIRSKVGIHPKAGLQGRYIITKDDDMDPFTK